MKIALAQMKMENDRSVNIENSLSLIRKAAQKGADLICFPEIQLDRFFPQYPLLNKDDYAVQIDDPVVECFRSTCRENKIFAVPNFYIKEGDNYFDMSLLIDDNGEVIGKQKMVHIAQFDKFYEQDYYTPSDDGFFVFDTKYGKIGIVVCFDRHYPESIRTEALRGAQLIIIPTANTTEEPEELFDWEVRIQAFQNSVNIAMCNRVGIEEEMEFNGRSVVTDYHGNLLGQADRDEELLIVDVDMNGASLDREKKQYHSLRRTKLYE